MSISREYPYRYQGCASSCRFRLVETGEGGGGTVRTAVNKDLDGPDMSTDDIEFVTDPDITGLTEVATLDTFGQISGEENTHQYPEGIILRTGNAIAIGVAVATTVISGSIHFHVLPEGHKND